MQGSPVEWSAADDNTVAHNQSTDSIDVAYFADQSPKSQQKPVPISSSRPNLGTVKRLRDVHEGLELDLETRALVPSVPDIPTPPDHHDNATSSNTAADTAKTVDEAQYRADNHDHLHKIHEKTTHVAGAAKDGAEKFAVAASTGVEQARTQLHDLMESDMADKALENVRQALSSAKELGSGALNNERVRQAIQDAKSKIGHLTNPEEIQKAKDKLKTFVTAVVPEQEAMQVLATDIFQEFRDEGIKLWELRKEENRKDMTMQETAAHALAQGSIMLSKAAAIHSLVEAHISHLKREIRQTVLTETTVTLMELSKALSPGDSQGDLVTSVSNFIAPVQLQAMYHKNQPLVMFIPILVIVSVACLIADWNKHCDVDLQLYFIVATAVECFVLLVRVPIYLKARSFQVEYERELNVLTHSSDQTKKYPKASDYDNNNFVIVVEHASSVPVTDFLVSGSKSDPFVVVTLVTKHGDVVQNPQKWSTKVRKNVLNPVWCEAIDFGSADEYSKDDIVQIELMDYDMGSQNDLIGNSETTVGELASQSETRLRFIDAEGKQVCGVRKARPTELLVKVLHVPPSWDPPEQVKTEDASTVKFDDLMEMGEEAVKIYGMITSQLPYKLVTLTTPFFAAWRMYGVWLMYDVSCGSCDAVNLRTLNVLMAVVFMVFFLYTMFGLVLWLSDMLLSTVGKEWLMDRAEDLDRQHIGFPVFSMIANQVLRHDKSHMAVYLRAKNKREIDSLHKQKASLAKRLQEVETQLKRL